MTTEAQQRTFERERQRSADTARAMELASERKRLRAELQECEFAIVRLAQTGTLPVRSVAALTGMSTRTMYDRGRQMRAKARRD